MVDKIDFSEVPKDVGDEYDSAFESEIKSKRQVDKGLVKERKSQTKVASKRQLEDELIREEGKAYRYHAVAKDVYSRHKEYINNYLHYYGGSQVDLRRDTSRDRRDADVIKDNHQFLWEEDDPVDSWLRHITSTILSLHLPSCLSIYHPVSIYHVKYHIGLTSCFLLQVGMRWRTQQEVVDGIGQFACGNKKCREREGLRSWEVNFGYMEAGLKKNALIKLRLCPDCSYKLNYHHKHKEATQKVPQKASSPPPENKRTCYSVEDAVKPEKSGGTSEQEGPGVWSEAVSLGEIMSREDEFDSYFTDMFL
ncbi:protein FRA10AC1 homolog [Physella acuta]|uniref:protein FRA10AC1 homolog n=1 Tax=Physella acuta TaxID=109671 RepID=UPI0027DE29B9|nr:protein FRA10AC1 homolog [Physella acuta]